MVLRPLFAMTGQATDVRSYPDYGHYAITSLISASDPNPPSPEHY